MALSANTTLTFIRGEQSQAPVLAAATIYEGAMLGRSTGYARGLVAGDPFIGHSLEYVDNSSGSSGDLTVKIMRGRYRLQVTLSGVAVTSVGSRVFASADDTLTLTPGANSQVGVVARYVTTDTAIVEFQTAEIGTIMSDLTALLSNLATITGSSDFTTLQSDVATNKSDVTVVKSDITALQSDRTTVESDVTTLTSDVVVIKSDITANDSDITVLASDVTTLNSDVVVIKSDITANDSDITVLASDVTTLNSDVVVIKSDITANDSDITVIKSDITAGASNTTVHISDVRVAIVAGQTALSAGDSANVSDLLVTITEILAAFSDALG